MPRDKVGEFLKRSVPKRKPDRIEEFLSQPPVAQPTPNPQPPTPGFLGNLEIGGRRALLAAADAGRVMEEALGAASRGDFGPLGQLVELAGRGVAPFVAAGATGPVGGVTAQTVQAIQAPRVGELTRQREERMAARPELFSKEAAAERARLDELAGRDPSLAGKITRRATEGVLTAAPSIIAGTATGGSVPAMTAIAGLQSMNAPEMLIPNVALAATPIPLGKVIAPIVRRIKAGRAGTVTEIPVISTETVLPGVEAPPALPAAAPAAQVTASPLQSAIRKLGTDSAEEIAEMIANANRRFNKTVTVPGAKARPITPAERQSAIEDYNRIKTLTKEENAALAEVLPERTYAPVQEGSPTSRSISDIPESEADAQLDANLRQLKAFFGSQDIVRESKIAAAVGRDAADPGVVQAADLGLETVPVPVRPADAVPVTRRISPDDISLGNDTLSKGRMFEAQESLKAGARAETKGAPLKQQAEPITVTPDPNRPGKFIVEGDDNHQVALMKLRGVTDDIAVKSFETPAQTAAIRSAVGPRAGEVAPMEAEIADQLRQAIGGMRARRGPQPPSGTPIARNLDPLEVESMAGAQQLPLMDVAQRNRLRKAFALAGDILQIPKSLMSSADISFPFRQGMIFLAPPSRWGRSARAMVEMFRALIPDRPTSVKGAIKAQFQPKTERFQRMADAIASDPDAAAGQAAGLKLGSQTTDKFKKADGEFVSAIADRIPIVRESQQAYTMAADYTRLNTFKLYKQVIDKRAAKEGFSADQIKRGYEAAARWINIGSGRGNFGEKADRALDALSFFIFSPRFVASRIQVLNPLTYLRNAGTPEGRAVLRLQMSEMAQMTAMVGGTLLLAKAAGFKVGTNPDRPDFLRISLGNYHYDGLAGLQPVMRLIYGVGKDALRAARGEKAEEGKTALDVASRFLRSKAAPISSFFVDYFDRKTFEGKPFDLTEAAVDRITPMQWGDFVEAYQREGLGGPLKLSPGAAGFGAQYYEPKPIDAAIEQRPELLNELTRLQIKLGDPRRKPGESDDAYKGRQEAIANLYSRFAVSLMSSRAYANQSEAVKQEAFDILHSRILNAVNTRDRRIGQFQPEAIINAVRRAEIQGKLRQKRIARRPPL